jgi:hypothetical protein
VPTAHASQAGNPAGDGRSFRRWRRARPFWGGLLLILSGVELFLSGNMNLGAMEVHVGPTGFLSYVVPAMLLLCGVGTWMTPNLRLFYGILGSLVAVYSMIGVNFGGFVIGLLLGIVGGALSIAWSPVTPAASAVATGDAETTAVFTVPGRPDDQPAAPYDDQPAAPYDDQPAAPYADQQPRYDHGQPYEDVQPYRDAPAHGETAEAPRHVQNPEQWWPASQTGGGRHSQEEPPPHGAGSGGGNHTRMLAITLVPVTLAAALLTVVHRAAPAYAVPCPTASASASAAPKTSPSPAHSGSAANKAQPSPSATAGDSGNPLLDVWNGLVDGIGKLFGSGDSAKPAAAPSPSPSPSPSASASAGGLLPGLPALPGLPGLPSAKPSPPKASGSAVPCLGPGVVKAATVPAGLPMPASTQAVLTGASVTMTNASYDGVAELTTATGKVKALQFTMQTSVTTPFQLKVREPNGKSTLITSDSLTTDSEGKDSEGKPKRTVKFYTSKFQGNLVLIPGLPGIPITFTPDSPPPLTLPSMTFLNPVIDLVFVRCDTLRAPSIHISEV